MIRGFAIDDPDDDTDTSSYSSSSSSFSSSSSSSSSSSFTTENVGYLLLSSTLGIIVGDVLWLEALRLLGPKRVIVFDSLRPFGASLLGWAVLGEKLGPAAYGGMALAVAGVGIVAWEEERTTTTDDDGGGDATTTMTTTRITAISDDEATKTEGTTTTTVDGDERGASDANHVRVGDTARTTSLAADEGSIVDRRDAVAPLTSRDDGNDDDDDGDDADAVRREGRHRRRVQIRGYACSIVNVFADSVGSLLTKRHGGGMTTWAINLIRFGYAGVVLGMISAAMRVRERWRMASSSSSSSSGGGKGGSGGGGPTTVERRECDADCGRSMDDVVDDPNRAVASHERPPPAPPPPRWYELPPLTRMGWLHINGGVALVTFLCPALSNYALFRLALGLAVSLGSVGPLYGLILDWPFKGRRPTVSGCAGALLAVAGVVILCLWGT